MTHNSSVRIIISLIIFIISLSVGISIGIRLGLYSTENSLSNEIYNFKEELKFEKDQRKCPNIPYPWRDFDLEPEPKMENNKIPPVSL